MGIEHITWYWTERSMIISIVLEQRIKWCKNNCSSEYYVDSYSETKHVKMARFAFKSKEDAVAYRLTYG